MDAHEQHQDALSRRAAQGERAALDELLAQHLAELRAFVRLRTGPMLRARESCSDLVQSVCREVVEDLPSFEYRGEEAFRGWLYSKAERKLADRARYWLALKRDARREEAQADWTLDGEDDDVLERCAAIASPSSEAIARERVAQIELAFQSLPENYRQVLTLSRIAGLSHAEIARRLDKTEVSVRTLVFRALAELAERLGPG